jgi:hypothetical protein
MSRKSVAEMKRDREERKKQLFKTYLVLQKKHPTEPVYEHELREFGFSKHFIQELCGGLINVRKILAKTHPDLFQYDLNAPRSKATKKDLIQWYIKVHNKYGRTPTKEEIRSFGGYTLNQIGNHYGGIRPLEKAARAECADAFNDVSLKSLRTLSKVNELRQALRKYKKFVVTTAVTGCAVHQPFLDSLKALCTRENAKLLILVCSDPAKPKDASNDELVDRKLLEETIILEDSRLNSNLFLSTIKLSAKQLNPTTGLQRIGKKNGSFIYASPKIFLKYTSVRNDKNKWPHCIMTTGAITRPEYNSEMYMSQRTAYIADHDHKLGAIFVEIQDHEKYHFTQVECKNTNGEIFFRDNRIEPSGVLSKVKARAFIMGDMHSGFSCPKTKKAWTEIIELTKPEFIAVHDGFNGISVNGWIESDFVAKYLRSKSGLDCVETELRVFMTELKYYASRCETLLVIPSNHNEWLERWLRKGKFVTDSKNACIGAKLFVAMCEGHNPLRYALEVLCGMDVKNIQWLDRNEDFYIEDIQVNCHGDMGVNGSKGSLQGMENAYPESFSGHSHTAGILRDAWAVGTSGFLQEEYNNGPGTWTNTSGLIYPGGCRALVNSLAGSWRR